MSSDFESTQTSRARLLMAGKTLFARHGYEQTSTATIAREAMTSESQLIRNFGGKAGLLQAVFNQGWEALNPRIHRIVNDTGSAREAIYSILTLLIDSLLADEEMAFLFLFEGRRFRGDQHEVSLSKGFLEFFGLVRELIVRTGTERTFKQDYNDAALASALVGLAESMIRDRLTAIRSGSHPPYSASDIREVFKAMFEAL